MPIVPMTNAVAGTVALSAEYNKLISNILDLDTRLITLENTTFSGLGAKARATSATPTNSIGATETIFHSVSFTAQAGRRYRVIMDQQFVFTDTSYFVLRGRWATGGTLTTAGTQFYYSFISGGTPGNWEGPRTVLGEITGIPAGTATVGFSMIRATGSGTVDARADASMLKRIYVDDVGV